MAGLFKDKKTGRYFVSYMLRGKQERRSTGIKNKAVADTIRGLVGTVVDSIDRSLPVDKAILRRLPRGIRASFAGTVLGAAPKFTLAELLDKYHAYIDTELAPRSRSTYRERIVHLVRFLKSTKRENLLVSEFDLALIDEYKTSRLDMGVGKTTINNELTHIKTLLNWAVERKYLDVAPISRIKHFRVETGQPRYLTEEEFQKIYECSSVEDRPILLVMAYTGIRKGEAVRLEWSDIDLKKKLLWVRNKPGHPSKTGTERVIPLAGKAVEALKSLRRDKTDVHVFLRLQRSGIRHNGLRMNFKRARIRAGIEKAASINTLRKTFASILAQKGVEMALVSKLMGHTNIEMTMTYYAHLEPAKSHSAVEKLDF